MPSFELTKWYADVVDPATGHLRICYDSTLRWQALTFRFTNQLQFQQPTILQSSASFAQNATATLSDDNSVFTLQQRGLHGIWQQQAPGLREMLLETPQGSILWECVFPAATARLRVGETEQQGLGYVEKLTVTLPPWHLPIDTLRWGRFVTPEHYLVWIRWDGPAPRHLIFYNGHRYADSGNIGDDSLEFESFQLLFHPKHTLRAGAVGRTVFQRFAWFRKLFPARILQLDEVKWLSEATLNAHGNPVASGYAVHERVTWPS